MMSEKTESRTLKGELYEGKDCLIVRGNESLVIVGEAVENMLYSFTGKNVELTVTVKIKETE